MLIDQRRKQNNLWLVIQTQKMKRLWWLKKSLKVNIKLLFCRIEIWIDQSLSVKICQQVSFLNKSWNKKICRVRLRSKLRLPIISCKTIWHNRLKLDKLISMYRQSTLRILKICKLFLVNPKSHKSSFLMQIVSNQRVLETIYKIASKFWRKIQQEDVKKDYFKNFLWHQLLTNCRIHKEFSKKGLSLEIRLSLPQSFCHQITKIREIKKTCQKWKKNRWLLELKRCQNLK